MPSPVLEVYASALHSQFFQPVYHQLVLHCLPTIGGFAFVYPTDNDGIIFLSITISLSHLIKFFPLTPVFL